MNGDQIWQMLLEKWFELRTYLYVLYPQLYTLSQVRFGAIDEFFGNEYTRVKLLLNTFWTRIVEEAAVRRMEINQYIDRLILWISYFAYDVPDRIKFLVADRYLQIQLLTGDRYQRILDLTGALWSQLDFFRNISRLDWDSFISRLIPLLYQWLWVDMEGFITGVNAHRARINRLLGTANERVEGIVGALFLELYDILAGSYQRLTDLTNDKVTSLYDILANQENGNISWLVNNINSLLNTVAILNSTINGAVSSINSIHTWLFSIGEPRIGSLEQLWKDKINPIISDPIGWLFALLQALLTSHGERLLSWILGV